MARKREQRKGRTTEQKIDENGRKIYEMCGQIRTLTDQRWDVESQSKDDMSYRVSLGCGKATCVTHDRGGCRCKHIAAAGYMLPKETVSSPKGKLIIGEARLKCPEYGKKEHVLNGKDYGK